MTNDAERVSDIVARLRAERDEAQSLVTAWQSVFEGIEAHLMDRVNMDDEASPKTYLEIIRSDVARVIVTSKQIVAARWADYARQQAIIEAQSKALAEARVVRPLQWGSEPPYLVARTRQGAHYSIEVMRDEDGNNPLIWTGGSFGSTTGKYLTVEAAKAAAQADHQQRILSALTTPTPENPNG